MPVLFDVVEHQSELRANTTDVESLVSDVKDRLCIKTKSHERHFAGNRPNPYQRSTSCSICNCTKKHNSSPVTVCQQLKNRHRHLDRCVSCRPTGCEGHKRLTKHASARNVEETRTILEKLLAEQSLIQEAVRRLQTQKLNSGPPAPAIGVNKRTAFRLPNNDLFDTTHRFSYSESEDDSLSQHSVDL